MGIKRMIIFISFDDERIEMNKAAKVKGRQKQRKMLELNIDNL